MFLLTIVNCRAYSFTIFWDFSLELASLRIYRFALWGFSMGYDFLLKSQLLVGAVYSLRGRFGDNHWESIMVLF